MIRRRGSTEPRPFPVKKLRPTEAEVRRPLYFTPHLTFPPTCFYLLLFLTQVGTLPVLHPSAPTRAAGVTSMAPYAGP